MAQQQLAEQLAALASVHDEIFGAIAYVVEFGKLELGTPQSKRLRETVAKLGELINRKPEIPADYPMKRNPEL